MSRPFPPRVMTWLACLTLALACGLFLLPTPDSDAEADGALESGEGGFAIVGAKIFDGEQSHPEADVWIVDGRIKAVGPNLELPAELRRIDGSGHTLLPGLIDAHVHTWGTAQADSVRFGVTALLDQFSAPGPLAAAKKARADGGSRTVADLFSAGILATAAGGHGTQFGIEIDTLSAPEQAADWVRQRKAEGSDWVKIVVENGSGRKIPTLDFDTVKAVIDAAHDEGLMALVHVSNLSDALAVARLGADGLVHVWRDRFASQAEIDELKSSGIFVIPTLVVVEGMVDSAPSLALAETLRSSLSSAQSSSLERRFPPSTSLDWHVPVDSVRKLYEAGVPILAGSDAPNPSTAMGLSLHREIQLLVAAGLPVSAALAAATSVPAQHFNLADRGRIIEGAIADLLLVNGDPTVDAADTTRLVRVFKAGEEIDLTAPAEGLSTDTAAIAAPNETLLADFETGLESRFGAGWAETTDQRMGGQSTAQLKVENGALVVTGEIKANSMFPWAGAMTFLAPTAMDPVDMSTRKKLRFRVRGDGRQYSAMLFSGDMQGVPPMQFFTASEQWQTVTLKLQDFAGADLQTLRAFSWNAGTPAGSFRFEIDEVEIR